MSFSVLCDFDGTITRADTADAIFSAFAHTSWRDIESLWEAGEIGSAECMRRQVELIDADITHLNACLDELAIDETFVQFAKFCEQESISLTIVSDGLDYAINRILGRYDLGYLPVIANHLVNLSNRRFTLRHPYNVKDCASGAGTCKCAYEARQSKFSKTILIGDGRSDFCVSHEVDIVFAKKSLRHHVTTQQIEAYSYSDFNDVRTQLKSITSSQTGCAVLNA